MGSDIFCGNVSDAVKRTESSGALAVRAERSYIHESLT